MKSVKELITIGKQCFENREYSKAEEYLQSVIKTGVRYADVYNMLGVIAHFQGKFASAVKYFNKALEINPRYTEATLNLAVLYNDLGQYADAKALYGTLKHRSDKTSCEIEPVLRGKLSNLHADIGDIYRSIGLHGNAITEYEKALELNPTYLDIRTKLAQALRENGKPEDSLQELKKVLRQDESYTSALIEQGITLYAINRPEKAQKSWEAALLSDKQNKHAQMYLRLCEASRNNDKVKPLIENKVKNIKTTVRSKDKKI
jgi:tetratricopeptide (TPR) repeat protein